MHAKASGWLAWRFHTATQLVTSSVACQRANRSSPPADGGAPASHQTAGAFSVFQVVW